MNWTIPEVRLDMKIRKLLTCTIMHHPKADVDRLYIPRNKEWTGMIQLELSYKTSTIDQLKVPYNINRLDATTSSCTQ